MRHSFPLLTVFVALAFLSPAKAAEQGGLLVNVSKKTIARNDGRDSFSSGFKSVDRMLTLKLDVKNTSMKAFEPATVEYVVLIERWAIGEKGAVERFEGTKPLEQLLPSNSASLLLGEYQIGGHMHGTSDMHVDHLVAWKVVVPRDGRKLEFTSGSNFDTLNRRVRSGN